MTLAERFDQWAQQHEQRGVVRGIEQGIEQGIERGIERGEAKLLQRQLTRCFGPLPATLEARLAQASIEQLETWGDRVLDAKSIDDVFDESLH